MIDTKRMYVIPVINNLVNEALQRLLFKHGYKWHGNCNMSVKLLKDMASSHTVIYVHGDPGESEKSIMFGEFSLVRPEDKPFLISFEAFMEECGEIATIAPNEGIYF